MYTDSKLYIQERTRMSIRMKRMSTSILAVLISLPLAVTAGQFGDYKPHGFLSDYSRLEPEGGDSDAYVYRNPEQIAKYNKLMIDRIKIYLKEDAESKEIDPAELKELVDYFHQAIVDAVSPRYPVVDEAGPDVLRLRIAITDLVPNKPEASMVTLVVPFLWVGEAGAGAKEGEVGSTPFVGEATVEMEAMDSVSNQQIAAYIETETAKKYQWNKGISEGIGAYTKAYSTWAYTKKAMDDWAKLIRERMDATH
ncbi:MAG: DUF3313 domain-containing protein [Gammaproteobacteria bacterium]|nr:MAG: DUF3313 domain-containing protein [Gammaproteobacteria bacterium]